MAAYSTDGMTWFPTTIPIVGNWNSVCYGNGKFVAVGAVNVSPFSAAIYSTDGITWEKAATELPQSDAGWRSVCYGKGRFVAVSGGPDKSTIAAYSMDGKTWFPATMPGNWQWTSVCYGNGKFVAVSGADDESDKVAYSTDGRTWFPATMPSDCFWRSVCYGDGKFIAVAHNDDYIGAAYSTDAKTWFPITTMPTVIVDIFLNTSWSTITYGMDDDVFGFL
jgi:hypothetical protein